MSGRLVIAGTDTNVGKTVVAAAVVAALDGCYWKPVQAGLDGETDSDTVRRLSGLSAARIMPEAYRFALPASPHIAAAREGIRIDAARLLLPACDRPLVIECAGGLMVPLNPDLLQIDQIARWAAPVLLVASTRLGTINHTLLSLEALRRRSIPVAGLVMVGPPEPEVEHTVVNLGDVRAIGRLPLLDPLSSEALIAAFAARCDIAALRASVA